MSVQLAPQHKVGLILDHPLLLANCTAELLALIDRRVLGAVVAPEVGGRQRRHRQIVERPGGFLVEKAPGPFSRTGLRQVLRAAGDLPVVGRVRAADPGGAARAARWLAAEGVSAVELDLLPGDLELARNTLVAVRRDCDLPLLARVPLLEAVPCAIACRDCGADALVVAGPPPGLAVFDDPGSPRPVEVHGPLLQPLFLLALQQVAQAVSLPLVARGGILTLADVRAYLARGAAAVAIDSLASVEPGAVTELGRALAAQPMQM